jgi:FkbM family methyltransferase
MEVPRLLSGRQQMYAQSDDGVKWMLDANYAQDGLGAMHEQTEGGYSVHDFIMDAIPAAGTFLDIGSHVGHYSVRAAVRGATVYAIEANPETAGRLLDNARLNAVDHRVHVAALAAWDCWETVTLAGAALVRDGGQRVGHMPGMVTVAAVPLDSVLGGVTSLDVVKIDVEGTESRVIAGMTRLLERTQPTVIIEDHACYGMCSPEENERAEALLTMIAGYQWTDIREHGVTGPAFNYRVGAVSRETG